LNFKLSDDKKYLIPEGGTITLQPGYSIEALFKVNCSGKVKFVLHKA